MALDSLIAFVRTHGGRRPTHTEVETWAHTNAMKRYVAPRARPAMPRTRLSRRKPRAYEEWKALRRWGRIPPWETDPPGYLLREAREMAGLTQGRLAARLGRTQQAIAQAERFTSNPTMEFVREWARALGQNVVLELASDEERARVSGATSRCR